ncbi:flagellar transcriptional regulator FlhD (plasmid) [Methylomonas sp. MED-D]|uniref:flagellar transcriptional regulator FlhD n=1 Tax=Methylomonas sp. MED-D TaxID=3418768 RepID=UPI003D03E560
MTDAIEAFNLKLLLFIREHMLDDQSSKLHILMGVDNDAAHLIKTASIEDIIKLSKVGFFLFSPRFECDELKKILDSNTLDPKTLVEIFK